MTLGNIIKAYRDEHSMSMDGFAQKSGLSKAYISILERNNNPVSNKPAIPSLETIKAVSYAINIDFNDVIELLDSTQEISLTSDNSQIPIGFERLPPMVKRPLLGRIACGAPILAEENIEDYIDVPEGKRVDFCLTCVGDSMIDAGVYDGDIVYIHKQSVVENGQIAAVRIGEEATLKRVYRNGNTLMLTPANTAYAPLTFSGEQMNEICIEGKAVGFTHWY